MKNIEVFNLLKELNETPVTFSGNLQTQGAVDFLANIEENISTQKVAIDGIQFTKFSTQAYLTVKRNEVIFNICNDLPSVALTENHAKTIGYAEDITITYKDKNKNEVTLQLLDAIFD